MGERGYIKTIQNGKPIYFYSHWRGYDLEEVVKNALIRAYTYEGRHDEQRWRQPDYLNRIIFSELVQNEIDSVTGYGISLDGYERDVMVIVNHDDRTVTDGEGMKKTYYQFTGIKGDGADLTEKKKWLTEWGITALTDYEISCMVMDVRQYGSNFWNRDDLGSNTIKIQYPQVKVVFYSESGKQFEVDSKEKQEAINKIQAILQEHYNELTRKMTQRAFNFGSGAVDNLANGLESVKFNEFKSKGKRVK